MTQLAGGMCTVDSAFSKSIHPFLIKSGKKDVNMSREEREMNKEAVSMRQSAEWGMRAFQSSFPRLKDRIPWEVYGKRKKVMRLMILLYNFRTRMIGINQIVNVYKKPLEEDANIRFMNKELNNHLPVTLIFCTLKD